MGREAGYKQCKIEKINSIASEVLSGEAGLNLHANKQVLPGGYHFQWIATGAESMGPEISISHNTLGAGVFLSSVLSRAIWKSFYRVISEQQGTGRLERCCLLWMDFDCADTSFSILFDWHMFKKNKMGGQLWYFWHYKLLILRSVYIFYELMKFKALYNSMNSIRCECSQLHSSPAEWVSA